ncbi:uncharacterized protein EV422DRAFT_70110 [Fimicolochytrium jonesii]|uniref:uncharacterized protein n=1 Tax=Fimicolochytrium jonesii TaxID=1396493 RepID=UPI0022FE604E|nr:uncharacterized protein EV422DRAFT_70110 [Fimicolochytrium jonesii]KAI8820434.1 hypothetical protein EV422DRAFT_70110 [Fimicolochytrium jonesii]
MASLLTGCPEPFVQAAPGTFLNTTTCVNISPTLRCCVPCPVANSFYPTGYLDRLMVLYQVIFFISFVCGLFLMITHIILPNRRRYQGILILLNNFGLTLYTGSSLAAFPNVKRNVQCAPDGIAAANWDNNSACAVQGLLFVGGVHLCLFAAFAIVVNLHFSVVWQSRHMERFRYAVYAFVIGGPATLTGLVASGRHIEAQPGFLCSVSTDKANELFFFVQAALVVTMLVLHIITAIWMYIVTKRAHSSQSQKMLSEQIKMQWRPALFTFVAQVAWFAFYLVYTKTYNSVKELLASDPTKSSWAADWFTCIVKFSLIPPSNASSTNAQDFCAPLAEPHLPNMNLVAFGLCIGLFVGLWNVIILISPQVIKEWKVALGLEPKTASVSSAPLRGHSALPSMDDLHVDPQADVKRRPSAHSTKFSYASMPKMSPKPDYVFPAPTSPPAAHEPVMRASSMGRVSRRSISRSTGLGYHPSTEMFEEEQYVHELPYRSPRPQSPRTTHQSRYDNADVGADMTPNGPPMHRMPQARSSPEQLYQPTNSIYNKYYEFPPRGSVQHVTETTSGPKADSSYLQLHVIDDARAAYHSAISHDRSGHITSPYPPSPIAQGAKRTTSVPVRLSASTFGSQSRGGEEGSDESSPSDLALNESWARNGGVLPSPPPHRPTYGTPVPEIYDTAAMEVRQGFRPAFEYSSGGGDHGDYAPQMVLPPPRRKESRTDR